MLTPEHSHNSQSFRPLLRMIAAKSTPALHNREKDRWHNLVERLFNKLKNWRRVATRCDKTQESYLGFVNFVAALK